MSTRREDASHRAVDQGDPGPSPAADRTVRVVLVNDHALVAGSLHRVLGPVDDIECCDQVDNPDAAVKAVTAHEPDVVVLELQHRDDGVEVIRTLAAHEVQPKVLVLSPQDDAGRVRAALRAGARGYLLADAEPDEITVAIRRVAAGRRMIAADLMDLLVDVFVGAMPMGVPPVTPRESEVLRLLGEGLPNRAVAERLGISTRTAQKHVENLFKKFNVHGRRELLRVAGRSGLLPSTAQQK